VNILLIFNHCSMNSMSKQVLLNILIPSLLGLILGVAIVFIYIITSGIPGKIDKILSKTEDSSTYTELLETKKQLLLVNEQLAKIMRYSLSSSSSAYFHHFIVDLV